jgi:predicted nucleic-acid-binding Zn-ribbon protein
MWEFMENNNNIIEALKKRGVNNPCPRCNSINFDLAGKTLINLNDNPKVLQLGGAVIPAVIIACSNCGFITFHSTVKLEI